MFTAGVLNASDALFFQTSPTQKAGAEVQQSSSFSSAVSISLSISAINATTGFLAAEKIIDSTEPDDNIHPRAGGIKNALKNLLQELDENNGLTGKVAKRLFKLVTILNKARGTDTKIGNLDKEDRVEARSARQKVNDFFREKHSAVFVDENLVNFITLVAKLETLHEFSLRTSDLLDAVYRKEDETTIEDQQPPLIDIEA